jgi:hypothetical protein
MIDIDQLSAETDPYDLVGVDLTVPYARQLRIKTMLARAAVWFSIVYVLCIAAMLAGKMTMPRSYLIAVDPAMRSFVVRPMEDK